MGKALEVRGMTKTFPGVTALDGVSFDLAAGEVHALCGENGAGKSTLIKVLSGIHPHGSYEGEILVDGRPAAFASIADAENVGIAVIYQELALIGGMTVAENVFLGAEPRRGALIDWHKMYADTRRLLDEYDLALDPTARVADLGIGQQQLVEIVKALAKDSTILLLDEPTAALTEAEVERLLGIVVRLRERGITCVYISHKLDEVFAIADRITVLRDGEGVCTLAIAATDKDEVIRHMVGREIVDFYPRRAGATGAALLEVQELFVAAEGVEVLQDISLEVRAGEVLGLGGLMGAGRSELLMHILGAYGTRTAGQVRVGGRALEGHSPADAIAEGLVLVSEDRKRYGLLLDKSIGFNLSLASLGQFRGRMLIDAHREIDRNQLFFDSLGIRANGQETVVASLSGGNQQKVVLGKALMTEPQVILLDEPTRGIDVGAKVEV
ncbi:MAG: sugar ABC transporter ATP-binding protein, partial [Candidatus Latescibacteria bacterium]|nr:sugar ABC transporter ATP-binding protein [Candidatus Latescibacterota bacterium]